MKVCIDYQEARTENALYAVQTLDHGVVRAAFEPFDFELEPLLDPLVDRDPVQGIASLKI